MTNAILSLAMVAQLLQGQSAVISTTAEDALLNQETVLEETTPPTVQEVLLNVCTSRGYSEDCAKTLLGMVFIESTNTYNIVGDYGLALGYFQIHYKMHGISTDCATDLVCSANWTLDYMEQHSYPTYINYAVQCHNSCGAGNNYAGRAEYYGERLWDEPMIVTQEIPIVLVDSAETENV